MKRTAAVRGCGRSMDEFSGLSRFCVPRWLGTPMIAAMTAFPPLQPVDPHPPTVPGPLPQWGRNRPGGKDGVTQPGSRSAAKIAWIVAIVFGLIIMV
nr:hypothetical protein [Phycisphaerales bacterium]